MTRIRVAAAVLNQTPMGWAGNQKNIRAAIAAARNAEVKILCLPELCITGYGCEDAFFGPGLQQTAMDVLRELLPGTAGMVVSLGLPVFHRHALFNCACVAVDGRVAGFVAKRFLSGDGLHYEPRWFKPWPQQVRDAIEIDGVEYPIGDLVFNVGGVKIGIEICEDAWVATRPGGSMSPHAVDVILNPSASHFAFGKFEVRKRLVLEGSRAFNVSYVYTNLMGNEAGRAIYDGGAILASDGKLLATGPRLSFLPWRLTDAVIDVDATRRSSARLASFQPELGESNPMETACEFAWPDIEPEFSAARTAAWETNPRLKEEEFTRAVALGLFDYLRKSRSQGFVVSLSGGADSSAVSCLVALMSEMAHDELGEEAFCQALKAHPGARPGENAVRARPLLAALRLSGHAQQQPGHARRGRLARQGAGRGNRLPRDR